MQKSSTVYFLKLDNLEKIKDLLPDFPKPLGFKCHFGEKGNNAFVPADKIKTIAEMVNYPPMLETSVLYRGPRSEASTHIKLAKEHGFDFAPIDILDGEKGDDFVENTFDDIKIKTKFKKFYLGLNLMNYESLLVVSHFKGHIASGFGGAIKNLSMGLASRRGKLDMHSGVKHQIKEEACIACSVCMNSCPVNAISYNGNSKAQIDKSICISCSKCIAVCPEMAIDIPWGTRNKEDFQKGLAEYAFSASNGKECFYVNFLINIVPLCDCMGVEQEKMCDDIGILVSKDPVAIDQASYDMVLKHCPEFKKHSSEEQLKHGETIGLGIRQYTLEKI